MTGNTWVLDISCFDGDFVHIGQAPESRGNCYESWKICCG